MGKFTREKFSCKCPRKLSTFKMTTFFRFFRPFKANLRSIVYLKNREKIKIEIAKKYYRIPSVLNHKVLQLDEASKKGSKNSGSESGPYALGFIANILACLLGKKVSAVGDKDMEKEKSVSEKEKSVLEKKRGFRGRFSRKNEAANKVQKMNMARQNIIVKKLTKW